MYSFTVFFMTIYFSNLWLLKMKTATNNVYDTNIDEMILNVHESWAKLWWENPNI